jgi:diguanylate cyclase (GGDEF)-like protein
VNLLSGGRLFQLADRLAVVQWLRLFLAAAVARYGGDEFVVLPPDCTRPDAIGVAERLRAAIAAEVTAVPVTVSAGVAHPASRRRGPARDGA